MTNDAFDAALDHLATINGFPRCQIDDAVFKARAAYFKQRGLIASNDRILAALELALASDATRRELFGELEAALSGDAAAELEDFADPLHLTPTRRSLIP